MTAAQGQRDPFADDVLERLIRSNQDYQREHGHYIVPLAERLLAARAENERLRTALEIAAPYISKRSDRGRAADVVVFSALGAETYRRLGLRGYEVAIPDGMPEDDGGVGYGTY